MVTSKVHFSIPLRQGKFQYVFPEQLASSSISHQFFKSLIAELNAKMELTRSSSFSSLVITCLIAFLFSSLIALITANKMLSSAKDLIILTVLVGVASSICVALTWLIYHGLFKRKVRKDMYLLVEGLNEVHVDRGCRIWKLRGKGEDLVLTLENDHRKGSEIELEKYQEELIV